MHQEDRFFTIAGICALLVTVGAFVWVHRGSIFTEGIWVRAERRTEVSAPTPKPKPMKVSPTPEHASRTVRTSVSRPPVERTDVIPAAFQPDAENETTHRPGDDETAARIIGAVVSIAAGTTPDLWPTPPPTPSDVLVWRDRDDRLVVAPGTHRRYDHIAAAIESVDPDDAESAFDFLETKWMEAAQDGDKFRMTLARAIDHLLEVGVPDVEPDMISKGTHWGFADTEFEGYSAVQKHMLLMGRHNALVVRTRLETIRELIGEPSPTIEPLPAPTLDDEILVAKDEQQAETLVVAAPQ